MADACSGGTCAGTPVAAPGETQGVLVGKSGTDATISWTMALGATQSDMLRGDLSALAVGPGGADETCFDDVLGTSFFFVAQAKRRPGPKPVAAQTCRRKL